MTNKNEVLNLIISNNRVIEQKLVKQKRGVNEMQKVLSKSAIFKIMVISALTAIVLVMFAGCGGTNPIGSWTLDRLVVDGQTIKASDASFGAYEEQFENIIILNEDNTASVKLGSNSAVSGTWAQIEKVITISLGGQQAVYTLAGSELIYQEASTKYFYKKTT
ncbi:MAG: hypothetical protein J6C13_03265 [Clostridia bacterium]|nr:hypothetical protein [Clostridia bacterium]